jgi:hypothetical protein
LKRERREPHGQGRWPRQGQPWGCVHRGSGSGVTVSVTKTLVASEAQARALGFVSSPTIRINGVDIAGELVESACDSCSESCACNGGVDCRD